MTAFQRYAVDLTVEVLAHDTDEARAVAEMVLPHLGAMHLAEGDVATVVGRAIRSARPAGAPQPQTYGVWVDASDVRDEVTDGEWSGAAEAAVKALDPADLNAMIADRLGDDFWHAMHEVYAEVIRDVCDTAGIPAESR